MRRLTVALLAAVAAAGLQAGPASAAADPGTRAVLLTDIAARYPQAARVHDERLAAQLRMEGRLLALGSRDRGLRALAARLQQTSRTLQPWPLATEISGPATRAATAAAASGAALATPQRPYDAIRTALGESDAAVGAGDRAAAVSAGLRAYALALGLRTRLGTAGAQLDDAFWSTDRARPGALTALDRSAGGSAAGAAAASVRDQLTVAEQTLGDQVISRGTVVTDAAILVFREGLEAVLILAAITASFVGTRRHMRRPVLIGGLAGIVATGVTWALVQLLVAELGTGGLRLEAITGLLAIAVLLVVTNWFFHRIYWSQWIARFNRRRKSLERLDRLGFLSGQTVALAVLGLTSVYREGFETVLFLQNLQVSAGTSACLLGSGIGLTAVLAVGGVTFIAQRKLPYKRMLIATGVLIAVVLAVMTGTTLHVMQGLGWVSTTPTGFTLPLWANSWLGVYATWEGVTAQVGALVVVLGSYVVARELQVGRHRRRARRERAGGVAPAG